MRQLILFIIIALLGSGTKVNAQADSTKYTPDFKFTDGIYMSFDEFKNNCPSIKHNAIINENIGVQFFVGYFTKVEKITYYDSTGTVQNLNRSEVWGYSSRGLVYTLLDNNFHRALTIGSIIFFNKVQDKPFTTNSKYTPYLIDFKTGKVLDYNISNLLSLLQRDQELFNEFKALRSNSKMKNQMFIYLRNFNERNPVYFRTN